jgi:hypothetical protein
VQTILTDGGNIPWEQYEVIPFGYATLAFVLKSGEWARPQGCKDDTLSMTVNGKHVLSFSGGISVCHALTMGDDYYNWHTLQEGDALFNTDGPRVYTSEYLQEPEQGCPRVYEKFTKGQRLDFAIRLNGNGDGKAPTVMYLAKGSVAVRGNDCWAMQMAMCEISHCGDVLICISALCRHRATLVYLLIACPSWPASIQSVMVSLQATCRVFARKRALVWAARFAKNEIELPWERARCKKRKPFIVAGNHSGLQEHTCRGGGGGFPGGVVILPAFHVATDVKHHHHQLHKAKCKATWNQT